METLTTTVIHCDVCDVRHADVELAIRCCGAMRVCFYYECSLCHRFFDDKTMANACVDYHLRIKDIRKIERSLIFAKPVVLTPGTQ